MNTIETCKKWSKIKLDYPKNLYNPITNRNIIHLGPKYIELEKICKKFKFNIEDLKDINIERKKKIILKQPLNKQLCKLWRNEKEVNPITHRGIKKDGIIYKEIKTNCK